MECVFGILKKRWKILEYGIRFRDIKVVEKVFHVCCMLHNMMLSEMKGTRETQYKVGRGAPINLLTGMPFGFRVRCRLLGHPGNQPSTNSRWSGVRGGKH